MDANDQNETTYVVVVNQEEQYALVEADVPLPEGWSDAGMRGSREECVAHVDSVWTDMRPLSLRREMDTAGAGG